MTEGLLERAHLLLEQQRHDDAARILGELLHSDPTNDYALYLLAEVNFRKENYNEAESLINNAISFRPDSAHYYFLKARLSLSKENKDDAEKYISKAVGLDPTDANFYAFWGQIKLIRKKHEEALNLANQALALDSNHIFALNVRSTALLKLNRKEESFDTIAEALYENPNDSYTHSNYGWGLLEKGDAKKALLHFSEALKKDPNSTHAQAGMMEALKARFVVYRWFLKYAFWMSNMAAKNQWIFILALFFGTKALRKLAESNETLRPFIYPMVMLLFIFAFSTWVIVPLSNLFLRLNPYGKYLLDKEEKITSSLTGVSLLISILSGITYFITGNEAWLILAFFTFTMMIPFSRLFAAPRTVFLTYTIAMVLVGVGAVSSSFLLGTTGAFAMVYLVGLIAFQFLANYYNTRS